MRGLGGYNCGMSTALPPPRPKIEAPPAWKWLMRVTGTFAMLLFLTPTFFVVKYYGVDKPREDKLVRAASAADGNYWNTYNSSTGLSANDLPALTWIARNAHDWEIQQDAIGAAESVLLQPRVGWERPLECLSAKAGLAEAATKDPNSEVRRTASDALGKVAQGGAVIRR